MKATVSLVLTFLLVISLCACGENKKDNAPKVDLQYYASVGEIPESPYHLGDDPKTVQKELSAAEEEEESESSARFSVTEGKNTVRIDNGEFVFCYEIKKEEKGISYIADLADAYGFEQGTIISEIKKALDPYPYTEREAKEDELFVLFGQTQRTILEYRFDQRTVLFVFEDNALTATILMDTNNWKY